MNVKDLYAGPIWHFMWVFSLQEAGSALGSVITLPLGSMMGGIARTTHACPTSGNGHSMPGLGLLGQVESDKLGVSNEPLPAGSEACRQSNGRVVP